MTYSELHDSLSCTDFMEDIDHLGEKSNGHIEDWSTSFIQSVVSHRTDRNLPVNCIHKAFSVRDLINQMLPEVIGNLGCTKQNL